MVIYVIQHFLLDQARLRICLDLDEGCVAATSMLANKVQVLLLGCAQRRMLHQMKLILFARLLVQFQGDGRAEPWST